VVEVQSLQVGGTVKLSAWRSSLPRNFEPLTLHSVKGSKFPGRGDRQAICLTVPPTWKLWTSNTAHC